MSVVSRSILVLMKMQKFSAAYSVANRILPTMDRVIEVQLVTSITKPIFQVETEEEFDEKVTNSECPVLVDFYADWCRDGQVNLAKINVDIAESLPERFGIRAVPTVLAIKNGEIVNRFEGDVEDDLLDEFIDHLVEE